jgi:hypothetical protein
MLRCIAPVTRGEAPQGHRWRLRERRGCLRARAGSVVRVHCHQGTNLDSLRKLASLQSVD